MAICEILQRTDFECHTHNSNIIRKKDIVRFVKTRRISWIGHVQRMENNRTPKRVMREKIYTRRKRGRPKVRWLDDVQEGLREMGKESSGQRPVEANSTRGQGSHRAVAPSDDDINNSDPTFHQLKY
jgi:hypothetical protein